MAQVTAERSGSRAAPAYGDRVHPLAGARARAYLLDCGVYLGIAAATVPIGVVAQRAGWKADRSWALGTSALPPLVATVLAARQESGPRAATLGKRRQGLVVRAADGSAPRFARCLLRDAVKIGVPWQLGHVVAIGAAYGGFERRDPLTLAATALTYPLLAVMALATTRGSGRALHDRVAGTRVRRAA